jgi:hypothetical protein
MPIVMKLGTLSPSESAATAEAPENPK